MSEKNRESWQKWVMRNCYDQQIVANWDGGCDSGGITSNLDNIPEDLEFDFIDACSELLGYHSWAGEFYSSGEIRFSKTQRALEFQGTETIYDEYVVVSSDVDEIKISPEISEKILELENNDIIIYQDQESDEIFQEIPESFFIKLKDGIQPEGYTELVEEIRQKIKTHLNSFDLEKIQILVELDKKELPTKIIFSVSVSEFYNENKFKFMDLSPDEKIDSSIKYVYQGVPNLTRELLLQLVKTTGETSDLSESEKLELASKTLSTYNLDHVINTLEWRNLKTLKPSDSQKYKDYRVKRLIFQSIRPDKFFSYHLEQGDLIEIDHRVFNIFKEKTEYWLYNCDKALDPNNKDVRANVLKCYCPSTKKEHWIMVGPGQKTILDALSFIFGSPSRDTKIIRHGDILFCQKYETTDKYGPFDPERQVIAQA
jgi:uncharacterized protein YehS (DUF1456 family)